MTGQDINLTAEQRERILRDLWVLNDGRWFLKTSQEHGFDEATRMNLMVVKSFGRTETAMLMQTAGIDGISDAEGLAAYLRLAGELFLPPEYEREFKVIDQDTVLGRVSDCFLYKHLSAAGTTHIHQCGAHTRFSAWLKALGLEGRVEAAANSDTCGGACEIFFHIDWQRGAS